MKISQKRIEALQGLVDKYKDRFIFDRPNILLDAMDELQKLVEFAFIINKEISPIIILGEDKHEKDTTKSLPVEDGLIYINLNKRCYHTNTDRDPTVLFNNEGVLLAGKPTFSNSTRIEKRKDLPEEIPIRKELFYSDNEFIFTVKTNTLKQQLKIINILEKSLNVYSHRITKPFVVVCGISHIETEPLNDKDELRTVKIYFHMRLKEESEYNNYYLIEAFKIAFDVEPTEFEVYNMTNSETINKNIESTKDSYVLGKSFKKIENKNNDYESFEIPNWR